MTSEPKDALMTGTAPAPEALPGRDPAAAACGVQHNLSGAATTPATCTYEVRATHLLPTDEPVPAGTPRPAEHLTERYATATAAEALAAFAAAHPEYATWGYWHDRYLKVVTAGRGEPPKRHLKNWERDPDAEVSDGWLTNMCAGINNVAAHLEWEPQFCHTITWRIPCPACPGELYEIAGRHGAFYCCRSCDFKTSYGTPEGEGCSGSRHRRPLVRHPLRPDDQQQRHRVRRLPHLPPGLQVTDPQQDRLREGLTMATRTAPVGRPGRARWCGTSRAGGNRLIVIVGCGARKRLHPCRAVDMYRGQYFRACWDAAAAVAEGNVYILSARYGLLMPGKVIAPYGLTVGQPGMVTADEVHAQALDLGIANQAVAALWSARYAQLCREAWPIVDAPLSGLGIGQQLHVLAETRRTGRLPASGPSPGVASPSTPSARFASRSWSPKR